MVPCRVSAGHSGCRRLSATRSGSSASALRLVRSHRGWDPGALAPARALARRTGAPLVDGRTSRLLVDLNRSPGNPAVYGELARGLPRDDRAALLDRYHRPHWERVREAVARGVADGRRVVHVAVHSFVPVLGGRRRDFDVGLLYDPRRAGERALAADWKARLQAPPGRLRVRRNAPYRGRSDGLPTALRRTWGAEQYVGIELAINQALLADDRVRRRLADALARVVTHEPCPLGH